MIGPPFRRTDHLPCRFRSSGVRLPVRLDGEDFDAATCACQARRRAANGTSHPTDALKLLGLTTGERFSPEHLCGSIGD
ncbi:hypothetical protein AB0C10_29550 [Microbispora amethystogenes]|uniref:hypothetical protein n=1 Tax=Microbispora amethystogenes TaxID=1427754 RepID=UPI0034064546